MTEQQYEVVARLLALSDDESGAVSAVLFKGDQADPMLMALLNRVKLADAAIRAAYVLHGPMEFRITVGHRDVHRAPGALTLRIGDVVKLVAQSTERWIPVQITALPESSTGYYHGVITEQLVKTSRFQVGNGVKFSEDQVMVENPRASSRRRIG